MEPGSLTLSHSLSDSLPTDYRNAILLGRMDFGDGPTPVIIERAEVFDMSPVAPTVSQLIERGCRSSAGGIPLGSLTALLADAVPPRLLAPIDLQCVKAAGVTFAVSALERVIEEAARGDPDRASALRDMIEQRIGGGLRSVTPGSEQAEELKQLLIADGLWSQYLEVAIGPDAEIFTKAPILSSVGWGMAVGVRSDSSWNNPEPEIVLVVDARGEIVGATLGNDVNLRDFEGRSALLLGKAKDNNAACALGPFIRLFDDGFGIDDIRAAALTLEIAGADGYHLSGTSSMAEISRDPTELVRQAMSEHHYPDGFVLFCGTLFAPTQDRNEPGRGFTHAIGDVVEIASDRLGRLINPVMTSAEAPAWRFGVADLMTNLAHRGLLSRYPK
jgi:fumarylacetoacetate (FAA) hydrolase family protein